MKCSQLKPILFLLLFLTASQFCFAEKKTRAEKEKWLNENWEMVLETERVVSIESEEANKFQKDMLELFKERYPNHDHAKRPIQFLLLDQDRDSFKPNVINAWTAKKGGVEYIALSKGIFQKVKNTDTVKFIIGHEYEHRNYRNEHGDAMPVEKGEEALCDILSMNTSIEKKESHSAILEDLEREVFPTDRKTEWYEYLDVHPIPKSRIRYLQTTAGAKIKEKGYTENAARPLSESLRASTQKAVHISRLDKLMQSHLWDQIDTVAKLKLIEDYIGKKENWNRARSMDVYKTLSKLKIDRSKPKEREAQDSLANKIIHCDKKVPDLVYKGAAQASHPGIQAVPLGDAVELESAIHTFLKAPDIDAAKKAAAHLNKVLSEMAKIKNFPTIDFSNFEFPNLELAQKAIDRRTKNGEGKLLKVPWNQHVHWALADSSNEIIKAMWQMGVEDPRLTENLSNELAFQLSQNKLAQDKAKPRHHTSDIDPSYTIIKSPREGSTEIENIIISKEGYVTNVKAYLVKSNAVEDQYSLKQTDIIHKKATEYAKEILIKALKGDRKAKQLIEEKNLDLQEAAGVELAHKDLALFARCYYSVLFSKDLENKYLEEKRKILQEFDKWVQEKDPKKIASLQQLLSTVKSDLFFENGHTYAANAPWTKFILKNGNTLFKTKKELSDFLAKQFVTSSSSDSYFDPLRGDNTGGFIELAPFHALLGSQKIKDPKEINGILEKINSFTEFEKQMYLAEIAEIIGKNKGKELPINAGLLLAELKNHHLSPYHFFNKVDLKETLSKLNWKVSLDKQIEQWSILHSKNLTEDSVLESKLTKILNEIAKQPAEKKAAHYEALLSTTFIPFPNHRKQIE